MIQTSSILLLLILAVAGCGRPLTTCTLTYGADQYHAGQRCPNNTVLVGTSGTSLICAPVTAACPIGGTQ